ncbi:hypothetical protein [Deinococcus multiflagellatus]|uniref:DUF4328 domain-containing protein n=1 Tax=Deinococcus multiflagellatus TaxID=1656887 RepID=A0ABW1ZRH1_9DEIO|nr:hypothetical protein [Deinococcus multiflagellatus]MBZ9714646.1 hypothetical protein [Deinococcus multiflagellatus]
MTTLPVAAAPIPARRPNYWLGLFLTFIAPGAGFTYLNRIPLHVAWLVGASAVSLFTESWGTAGTVVALVVTAFLLMHYRDTFAKEAAQDWARPALAQPLKWGIIGVHLVLSVGLQVVFLATSLIPGLLEARGEAQEAAIRSYVMNTYLSVYADSVNGKAKGGDCLKQGTGPAPRNIVSCRVDVSDPQRPTLTVTTSAGETLTFP